MTLKQPMIVGNKVLAMAELCIEKKAIVDKQKNVVVDQKVLADSSEYRDALIKQIKDLMVKQRKQEKPP